MKRESVAQRMRLLRRLLDRSSVDPRHNVAMPGGKPRRTLATRYVASAWRRLARRLEAGGYPGHYYSLYLHLPFCPADCTFCLYDHQVGTNREAARAYVDGLRQQIDGFSPEFEGVSFQNLLVGGGTPTWLDEGLLDEVLAAVLSAFDFAPSAAKVVEANPGDISASAARMLVHRGLNAVSLGVHSLDPTVLASHGRGFQDPSQIGPAIDSLRAAGAEWVECDVLVGLWGDDATGVARTVEQLMEWSPDGITLTKLRPRQSYLDEHFQGEGARFASFYRERFAHLADALETLCADAGFEASDLRADELSWKLRRRGGAHPFDPEHRAVGLGGSSPSSTLGLGRLAHSKIYGELLVQYQRSLPAHDPAAEAYFGVDADGAYEAARWLGHHLVREGAVDGQAYRRLFEADLREAYPHLIAELEKLNAVRWNDDQLQVCAPDDRERFVVSRLFFHRQTAVQELSMEDWERLHIRAGAHRFCVRVDHLRADRPNYFAVAGSVGLLLEQTTAPGSARERLLLGVLAALLRRVARSRPWLAALEVAERLADDLPRAVASRLAVTVELDASREARTARDHPAADP